MSEPQILLPLPTGEHQRSHTTGEKWMTLDLTVARLMLEKISLGQSIFEIEQESGMAPANAFIQWVMLYPDLARAYTTARELSGFMLEEEALFVARKLAKTPVSAQNIKATEVLLAQLKWSAGKRNPSVFSDKAALNVTVPIQINTTLDLGDGGMGAGTKQFPDIYDISAKLETAVPLEDVPLDVLERELAKAEGREVEGDSAEAGTQGRKTRSKPMRAPLRERGSKGKEGRDQDTGAARKNASDV